MASVKVVEHNPPAHQNIYRDNNGKIGREQTPYGGVIGSQERR